MRNVKKVLLFIILVMTFFTVPNILAESNSTTVLGGVYKFGSREETNELAYGIKHYRDFSETSADIIEGNAAGLGGGGIGVANQLYPQQVNVLEVPSSKEIKVVNWSTTTAVKWNLNTVRAIAFDYERNNPGWKVIGAINGDFFDIRGNNNLPYQTNGASVSNGNFIKSSSGSTVGFTNDGSSNSLIGGEKVERSANMKLAIYDENGNIIKTFEVEKRNSLPNSNETSVYFANWNSEKQISPITIPNEGNTFVVENADKALANGPNDFYGLGTITSSSPKILNSGEFAIVTKNAEVNNALKIGLKVRVQYEYIGAYANVTDATGAGATLLKNGEAPTPSDKNRHPRTMIGKKDDGTIVMAVIDGRQPEKDMYGATQVEMAALMKHYGCVDAFNLDGGGSSTLIIRDGNNFRVTNSPSDGKERTDANAILVVSYEPEFKESTVVTINSINLELSLKQNNGHDVKKVYIKLNGVLKELVDGKVTFTNLEPNTEYLYTIYYKDSKDILHQTIISNKVLTAKRMPRLLDFKIETTNNVTKITPIFADPDKSMVQQSVTINKKTSFVIGGFAEFKNLDVDFNKDVVLISYNYRYNLNDGQGVISIDLLNPNHPTGLFLQIVLRQMNEKTINILN